jgi:hypothetical protein
LKKNWPRYLSNIYNTLKITEKLPENGSFFYLEIFFIKFTRIKK